MLQWHSSRWGRRKKAPATCQTPELLPGNHIYLVKNRMPSSLQGQCSGNLWFHVVPCRRQLTKGGEHVHQGHGFADTKQTRSFLSDIFYQLVNDRIASNDDFVRSVGQSQVEFDKVQCLALNLVLLPHGIDKNIGERIFINICALQAEPIFAAVVKSQIRISPVLFYASS